MSGAAPLSLTVGAAAKRAVAISLWGAVSALAAAVGPSLGSLVVDSVGWPWAFYINLPIGILGIVLVSLFIANTRMMAQQIDKTATEMTDSFSETAVRVTQQVSDVNRVIAVYRRAGYYSVKVSPKIIRLPQNQIGRAHV